MYDEYNGEEIVLSKEEMRMIARIRAGGVARAGPVLLPRSPPCLGARMGARMGSVRCFCSSTALVLMSALVIIFLFFFGWCRPVPPCGGEPF